ncbi:MAG: T9SS type A sorting domain-containing protein [Bacteroidota bacterium]
MVNTKHTRPGPGILLVFLSTVLLSYSLAAATANTRKSKIVVALTTTLVDASVSPYNQIQPGDTLFFEPGTRDYLLIRNFRGATGNPVIFLNLNGVVIIDTDHQFGISISDCQFIRLSGTGSIDNFYGFKVQRVLAGAGLGIGYMSSDVEIDHLNIQNVPIAGIYAKTDPDCSFTSTRDKFTQFNTIIHDNYILGAGNEGMYIGSSKYSGQEFTCNGRDTVLLPSLLDGVKVYSNIISYAGWDGIQVSSASANCQVYDNLVLYDSQDEQPFQMSGILLGGGSKCDCFNNYIANGKGDGIESHGLGGYRIFNNVIVNAGKTYKPGDSTQMKHGIFVSDVSVLPDSSFYILFNDIINPKSDGIRFSSVVSRNNLIASNVIINPGNFDYYEHGNTGFRGKDSYVMIPDASAQVALKNNWFSRTQDSARFDSSNYTLLPGSLLIDAASPETHNVTFDFYHHLRPYGNGYDIGAFEYNPAYLGVSQKEPVTKVVESPFPNPVSKTFTIKYQCDFPADVTLRIYSLQGAKLYQQSRTAPSAGSYTLTEDVENLPEGIYLYTLQIGKQQFSGRMVKKN